MLDVGKAREDVEKVSNMKKPVTTRVCEGLGGFVIMLLEKKREAGFFTFAPVLVSALAESLVFPFSLQNHANIITLGQNSLKSTTYAMLEPNITR